MSIEIKTSTLEPIRNTFEHTKRRFGDKPASRYQEASYDIAPEKNFHYRPMWQPDKLLNDTSRTAVVMEDWYAYQRPPPVLLRHLCAGPRQAAGSDREQLRLFRQAGIR